MYRVLMLMVVPLALLLICADLAPAGKRHCLKKAACDDCCIVVCSSCGCSDCGCGYATVVSSGCASCGGVHVSGEIILNEQIIGERVLGEPTPAPQEGKGDTENDDDESPFLGDVSTEDILAALQDLQSFVSQEDAVQFQDSDLAARWYGLGYHAYWSGNYQEALDRFNAALEAFPQESRAWYYRGLTEMALGEKQEAAESFARAVQADLAQPGQSRQVAQALERVQGKFRLSLVQAKARAAEGSSLPSANLADNR